MFEYDVEALIEPFIKNRLELNVAVAGLDEPVASVTEMPVTSQASPLTFSEKYKRQGRKSVGSSEGMAGALRVLDPAGPAGGDARDARSDYATTVFAALGCEGISRIDFLIDADSGAAVSSTRSTRCPARWRSICGRPRRTTGRSPIC